MFNLDEVTLCRDCGCARISQQVSAMVPLNTLKPLMQEVEKNIYRDDYFWCEDCEDECVTITISMGDDVYHTEYGGRVVQISTESLTLQDGVDNFHIIKFPAKGLVYRTNIT